MEISIILAGHGSGKPSTKGMNAYCKSRQAQDRGLVEVRRFPNLTSEQRQQMHDTYMTIIGRNIYSQSLRAYCYDAYEGRYYSDCSSSICRTAEKVGIPNVSSMNTAGMHYNLEKVENVIIKNGIIQNPEILLVGDALMFKGADPSRPLQIGHTEMVYIINRKTGIIETPSITIHNKEYVKAGQMHMNNFINAGLLIDGIFGPLTRIAAIMALQMALNMDYCDNLEVDGIYGTKTKAILQEHTICLGDSGYLVTFLEIMLLLRGYNPNGVEYPGILGNGCMNAVRLYQKNSNLEVDGIAGILTFSSLINGII